MKNNNINNEKKQLSFNRFNLHSFYATLKTATEANTCRRSTFSMEHEAAGGEGGLQNYEIYHKKNTYGTALYCNQLRTINNSKYSINRVEKWVKCQTRDG